MQTYHYCIQCKDENSGNHGIFFYDFERLDRENKFFAISPIFSNLVDFYTWAKNQDYSSPRHTHQLIMMKEENDH